MLKIIDPKNSDQNSLAELMQTITIKFSFAKLGEPGTVLRIHDWIKCRDFFNEVLVGHATKKEHAIYGFSYGPDNIPIDEENLTLLIKFPDVKTRTNFQSNWSILEQLCTNNNAQKPILVDTEDPFIKLLISDKVWQLNIPRLSYYTYILKVMNYSFNNPMNWMKELKAYIGNSIEKKYLSKLEEKATKWLYEDCLFLFPNTNISGHEEKTSIVTIHNYSGFFTVCNSVYAFENNTHRRDYQNYEQRKAQQREALLTTEIAIPATNTSSIGKPKRMAKAINPNTKTNLKKRQQTILAAAVPA